MNKLLHFILTFVTLIVINFLRTDFTRRLKIVVLSYNLFGISGIKTDHYFQLSESGLMHRVKEINRKDNNLMKNKQT